MEAQTLSPRAAQRASWLAVRERIEAPREIFVKPRPRPFVISTEATYALRGHGPITTLEDANQHVREYLLHRLMLADQEPDKVRLPSIAEIITATSLVFAVSCHAIKSKRLAASIVRPRQIGMYLARELLRCSYPQIGRHFGDRDHTTILYAARKIERMLAEGDSEIRAQVSAVLERLGAKHG